LHGASLDWGAPNAHMPIPSVQKNQSKQWDISGIDFAVM
jgi:hypothetical protein